MCEKKNDEKALTLCRTAGFSRGAVIPTPNLNANPEPPRELTQAQKDRLEWQKNQNGYAPPFFPPFSLAPYPYRVAYSRDWSSDCSCTRSFPLILASRPPLTERAQPHHDTPLPCNHAPITDPRNLASVQQVRRPCVTMRARACSPLACLPSAPAASDSTRPTR